MPPDLGVCDRHESAAAHAIWVSPTIGALSLCAHCDRTLTPALKAAGFVLFTRDKVPA